MHLKSHPSIFASSIAVILAFAALPALAVTETVIATSDGTWNADTNWADSTSPATGSTFANTRLNVNGLIIYDFPGVTTTFMAGGAEMRPMAIASGANTNGTLRVDSGTLVFTTVSGAPGGFGPFVTAAADATTNSTGLLHVNGGNVIIDGSTSFLSLLARGGSTSTGTLTIDSGSMTVDRIDTGNLSSVTAGSTATINLNGGTLNVRSISSTNATMQFRLNLNGGTIATNGLPLTGVNVNLIGQNIDSALLNGVVTFDTTRGDGSITATLTGAGGIIKEGARTLSITGGTKYTGPTVVNAGTLSLTTAQSGTSSVTIASGATFDVRVVSPGTSFTTPTLVIGSTGGATIRLNQGAPISNPASAVLSADDFTVAAGSSLELTGSR
jgi:fibronectin-binding autotransporter adhesin